VFSGVFSCFRVFVLLLPGLWSKRRAGAGRWIGSRWGNLVPLALTHHAASCRASIRAPPGFQASRPGGALLARPRNRPRSLYPACPMGDLPRTPTAARPDRPYELPRLRLGVAPCGTIPRIAVPGPWDWGPYEVGRKSRAFPAGGGWDHPLSVNSICREVGVVTLFGTSVPSAPGLQLPLLGTSGT
jgi:hypothetical protein